MASSATNTPKDERECDTYAPGVNSFVIAAALASVSIGGPGGIPAALQHQKVAR